MSLISPIAPAGLTPSGGLIPPQARVPASAPDFATLVGDLAGSVVGDMRRADAVAIQGLQGQTDLRTVVDTVMEAQRSLQAAVAIRDKLVAAWLDISRMQI